MSLLEISVQDVISFACWLAASYGLSKIFKKFHIEGWWAFIPGARIYWLGRCADREDDGKIAMIFELLTFPVMLAMQLLNENLEVMKYILLLNIFLGIVCMIYKARICIDLCGDLKVNKNWAWLWVFAEVIPCLVWGFSDKYTPSKALLRYNGLDPVLDDELIIRLRAPRPATTVSLSRSRTARSATSSTSATCSGRSS